MKKIFQLTSLLAVALLLFSCTKKEISTDQYDSAVVALKAYGPQPVVRGGVLRFVGSNLDKVVSVTIPGVDPLTPEVVTSGVHSEIRVTVPKDGPEPGYPVLTLADGGTLTGKTLLTYSEPIIFEGFSPLSVYPGDKITITGDYLNLIHEVVFASDVIVGEEDFTEHTRYKIVVGVPAEARTGKIALGTVDQTQIDETTDEGAALLATLNLIESEDELTVGTATGTFPEEAIKAGSVVTITGSHLMLVEEIEIEDYTISEFDGDNSKISFPLSELAPDGEVVLVMASGIGVPIGTLTTVKPSELAVNPAPVKAGTTLTVSGKDLDLVDNIAVGGVGITDFACNEDGTEITFSVPDTSVDGDIVLIMVNRSQVTVPFTLVVPTITAVAPTPVPAGENFTVTGTDLDLVKAVAIGEQEMEFEVVSATELTVKTDAATLGGTLSLTTANGTVVTFEDDIVFDYGSVTQVTALTEKAAPGESVTMTGSGFNAIEAIYIGGVKVTSYSKREDTEMVFLMPEVEFGTYAPEFLLTTGETESPAGFSITYEDEGGPIITTIWTGEQYIDWSGNSGDDKKALATLAWGGYDSDFANVVAGTTLQIFFTENTEFDYWQIELRRGADWGQLPEQVHYDLAAGQTVVEYKLTAANLAEIQSQHGLVITGCNLTITKVNLVVERVVETTIWSGEQYIDWSGNSGDDKKALTTLAWGGYDSDFASVEAGKTLSIYVTENTEFDYWQIELRRGADWGQLPEQVHFDLEAGQTVVEYALTAANLAEIQSQHGLVITGCNLTITKVTLK